ncbi:MAG TPA: nucleotidyltransferase family protein [Casimicrobiaceae bacterium]|nr:nucleotidyltransferase family protein [Casimicrobiaceae bacterium]
MKNEAASVGAHFRAIGVLLAAGRGARFGADKLIVPLTHGPDRGLAIGIASFRHLRAAIDDVIAVVRPDASALSESLVAEGARVIVARDADDGMGASLSAGVTHASADRAYVVALADMPWISPATIARVVDALRAGASIAAPRFRGERGHPVGFSIAHRAALMALRGDEGARALVASLRDEVTLIDVDDEGVVRDIDTQRDLESTAR